MALSQTINSKVLVFTCGVGVQAMKALGCAVNEAAVASNELLIEI